MILAILHLIVPIFRPALAVDNTSVTFLIMVFSMVRSKSHAYNGTMGIRKTLKILCFQGFSWS